MSRALEDPYYTRVGAHWELVDRADPVVWGDGEGPLSADELRAYDQQGFVIKPGLFSEAEIATLLAEAERMAAAADRERDDVIIEPGSDAVRSLFRVHRDSATMRRLIADPRLTGVARQILGDEVYVHQSRINFKPAFEGKPFPWHSDFETWHSEDGMPRMRALSASVLLTPNTEHNGPLLLVPGSHRRFVRCVGETPPDHFKQSLRRQEYGVPDRDALSALIAAGGVVSATGPVGTVVFFDCNVMHGSAGNITSQPRHNVFVVFNSVSNRLLEPYGGTRPRPSFLAERQPIAV
jgi:ectoine hydroxylase